jgi:hypothetical protein
MKIRIKAEATNPDRARIFDITVPLNELFRHSP